MKKLLLVAMVAAFTSTLAFSASTLCDADRTTGDDTNSATETVTVDDAGSTEE